MVLVKVIFIIVALQLATCINLRKTNANSPVASLDNSINRVDGEESFLRVISKERENKDLSSKLWENSVKRPESEYGESNYHSSFERREQDSAQAPIHPDTAARTSEEEKETYGPEHESASPSYEPISTRERQGEQESQESLRRHWNSVSKETYASSESKESLNRVSEDSVGRGRSGESEESFGKETFGEAEETNSNQKKEVPYCKPLPTNPVPAAPKKKIRKGVTPSGDSCYCNDGPAETEEEFFKKINKAIDEDKIIRPKETVVKKETIRQTTEKKQQKVVVPKKTVADPCTCPDDGPAETEDEFFKKVEKALNRADDKITTRVNVEATKRIGVSRNEEQVSPAETVSENDDQDHNVRIFSEPSSRFNANQPTEAAYASKETPEFDTSHMTTGENI
eukprot:TRINITY_DN436_c0_g2_i5.p1 TRINITY_DN436_c0_g2~~TRINITY_DN436_c0_g2_i5.p1  ORF type:complete len:398 (+),score=110.60 TRINITY_DN436_c0_g2_i5:159-1352(+)